MNPQPDHQQFLRNLDALAQDAVKVFDLSEGVGLEMINLSENATYRVDAAHGDQCWALRIHREGYHSKAAIASELAWIRALREDGVVVTPTAIAGKNGEMIQLVSHPAFANPRHVVLFQWEEGVEPSEEDDLRGSFEILGEQSARMHAHVQTWQRPDFFERFTWDFETSIGSSPHWGRWRDGIGVTAETAEVFQRAVDLIERRLESFGKSPERFGLIHGDMRLANLLIDGDVTKVIDFDDSGFGWFMYDCAAAVSFFEHRPEVPELLEAWVRGYRRITPLSEEDAREIPTFVMLRRLLLVAWIGSHSETDLAQSMGEEYTQGTIDLCRKYLSDFG